MTAPRRGEVWLVDLGMAAKVRPALAISVPAEDTDRALGSSFPTRPVRVSPDLKRTFQFHSYVREYSTHRILSRFLTRNWFDRSANSGAPSLCPSNERYACGSGCLQQAPR